MQIWEIYESGGLISTCAWCGRVKMGETWVMPPVGALSTIDEPVTLSHAICPDCTRTQPAPKSAG